MKNLIFVVYDEEGIWPFLAVGSLILLFGFFCVVLFLQGSANCFHAFQSGDFCSYCGEALQEYCPYCDKAVDNCSFCPYCGHALN